MYTYRITFYQNETEKETTIQTPTLQLALDKVTMTNGDDIKISQVKLLRPGGIWKPILYTTKENE